MTITTAETSNRADKIVALTTVLRDRGIDAAVAEQLSTQAWEAAARLAGCTTPSHATRQSVVRALASELPDNPLDGLPVAGNAFKGFR